MLKVTLFLKSLDYKHLPHAQRVSHDFLSLLRTIFPFFAFFAFFACLLVVPHCFSRNTTKTNIGERKGRFCFFSGLGGSLSLFFTGWFIFFSHFQLFFPLFFFRFVCVCVVGALRRGRAWRRRVCRRMPAGRGGVAKSSVAVFVARRRVCLREGSMNGLSFASI